MEGEASIFNGERQLSRTDLLPTLTERADQRPLPMDEILSRLAILTQQENLLTEQNQSGGVFPQIGHEASLQLAVAPPPPTLPHAGLAFLTEMLAHARTSNKANTLTGQTSTASVEGASNHESALRVISHHRGGGNTASSASGTPLSTHTSMFSDELVERVARVRIFSRGGGSEQQVRVTLLPEELGTVDLRLRVDGQNRVHLLIMTETDAARDLMQRQMSQLRDALERQNMTFGDVHVEVDTQQRGGGERAHGGDAHHAVWQDEDDHADAQDPSHDKRTQAAISASEDGLSIFV